MLLTQREFSPSKGRHTEDPVGSLQEFTLAINLMRKMFTWYAEW